MRRWAGIFAVAGAVWMTLVLRFGSLTLARLSNYPGAFAAKVGPVQRYRSVPFACIRFQCLARSDQFHRMGRDRIGAPSRAATILEVRHSRLAGEKSPL